MLCAVLALSLGMVLLALFWLCYRLCCLVLVPLCCVALRRVVSIDQKFHGKIGSKNAAHLTRIASTVLIITYLHAMRCEEPSWLISMLVKTNVCMFYYWPTYPEMPIKANLLSKVWSVQQEKNVIEI